MDINQATERYRNDATFCAFVNRLRQTIIELDLTPGEVRDAAMFAAYLVELERPPQPMIIPPAWRCPACGYTANIVGDQDGRCLNCQAEITPEPA